MLATSAFTLMKNKVVVFKHLFTIVSLNIVKLISLAALFSPAHLLPPVYSGSYSAPAPLSPEPGMEYF